MVTMPGTDEFQTNAQALLTSTFAVLYAVARTLTTVPAKIELEVLQKDVNALSQMVTRSTTA